MSTATTRVFRLPDLGEGLTEAELVQWLVQVGDTVTTDQAIAEVETAKSIVELPTPFAGTVLALHGTAGETLLVGAPVIEVGDAGAAPSGDGGGDVNVEHEAYRAEERAGTGSGNVLIGYGTGAEQGAARRRPRAARAAATAGSASASSAVDNAAAASPSVPGAAPAPEPAVEPAPAASGSATSAQDRPKIVPVRSPLLRRLIRDLGLDIHAIVPTGADGVITRGDIMRAASEDVATAVSGTPFTIAAGAPGDGEPREIGRERLSMLRRTVGAKMSRSRSEIPEATVWVDVDATPLWELRAQLAETGERAPSLTTFLAKFTLLALAEYPLFASRLSDDGQEVISYEGVNLGIAADTDRGLMVPSITRADTMDLRTLDQRLREVAEQARTGGLPPEQLRGSTFTLNNYGSLGVDGSAAVINHPEVAILGIGRMIERPWVVAGEIVPRRIAQLSFAFDHRICDGGYASGFLRHVVTSIEHPLSLYTRL